MTKGALIEKFTHNHCPPVEIRFDKKVPEFRAAFDDVTFTDKSLDGLRGQLCAAMESAHTLVWQEVLAVTPRGTYRSYGESAEPGLAIERFRIARRRDGTYTKIGWGAKIDAAPHGSSNFWVRGRERDALIELPTWARDGFSGDTAYLPYSEDTWLSLLTLIARLGVFGASIERMVRGPKAFARFSAEVGRIAELLANELAAPDDADPAS